jgi:ParB family chromosome partitioning protein
MITDLVVAKLDAARMALAEAKTIQETKKILDVAAAAEIYAKRQQLGEEAIQYATTIKIEALAQLGRMLKGTPRNPGARLAGRDIGGAILVPPSDIPTLAELGLDKKTSKLARDIAELPEEELEKVKERVVSLSKVLQHPHVSYNTGNSEWYTPTAYIEAARAVMGSIDVDPASSPKANETVKATKYHTVDNDGRNQAWPGNAWMNPPYAQPLISEFCDLLVRKYQAGEVKQACVLVNNATETIFYQNMLKVCSGVCFIKGRVKFVDEQGNESGAPLQGQTVLYFGNHVHQFTEIFQTFGVVLHGNSTTRTNSNAR